MPRGAAARPREGAEVIRRRLLLMNVGYFVAAVRPVGRGAERMLHITRGRMWCKGVLEETK